MLYRLCTVLGYPTPRHLLQHLDSRDISGWIAYYNIEPFGGLHDEHLAGVITSQLYNCHRGKDQLPSTPSDHMPNYVAPLMESSEMQSNFYAWIGAPNGTDS